MRHVHMNGTVTLHAESELSNVWEVSRDNGHGKNTAIHANQKPVELARRAIKNSSLEGEIVLDLFSGSASTIMGAEQTKRAGYGVELDPHNVDLSVKRWQDYTGKQAIHATEHKAFDDLARTRKAKVR